LFYYIRKTNREIYGKLVIQDITWGKIFCGKKEKDIHDEAKPKESSPGEGTKHMKFPGI
jgi:hypothetical protein